MFAITILCKLKAVIYATSWLTVSGANMSRYITSVLQGTDKVKYLGILLKPNRAYCVGIKCYCIRPLSQVDLFSKFSTVKVILLPFKNTPRQSVKQFYSGLFNLTLFTVPCTCVSEHHYQAAWTPKKCLKCLCLLFKTLHFHYGSHNGCM